MLYLDLQTLTPLLKSKNLLAFSAGVDSSALFFILLENNIKFDIAIVNYQTRDSSKDEENYAKELAKKYNLKYYILKAPPIKNNFEKTARDIRYNFFKEIINKDKYNTLITAHQLNDQLEWLLMRLSKGAGAVELVGLEPINQKDNYQLIRPILHYTKDELLKFLRTNNHKYFIDNSNFDTKYERNLFREKFSNQFLELYYNGVKRSFDYLREDKKQLTQNFQEIYKFDKLVILKLKDINYKIKSIDITLKKLGYLLSNAQRREISKSNSIVIGGLWVVEIEDNKVYISPFIKTTMPKEYKEICRRFKVPTKIRPYCFENSILPQQIN